KDTELWKQEAVESNGIGREGLVVKKEEPVRVGMVGKDKRPVCQVDTGLNFVSNSRNRQAAQLETVGCELRRDRGRRRQGQRSNGTGGAAIRIDDNECVITSVGEGRIDEC